VPIDVQCAACGKRLRAPDEQAGRKGRCPACKAELQIPASVSPVKVSTGVPNVNTPTPVPKGYVPKSAAPINSPPPARQSAAGFTTSAAVPPPIPERRTFEARDNLGARTDIPPVAETEGVLEAKHWFVLGTALQITKYALLLSWIAFGCIGLALIGLTLASRSASQDAILSGAISLLLMWGIVGTILGWTALLVGWLLCMTVWSALERRWLRISIGASVFLIVAILILISVQSLRSSNDFKEEAKAVALTTEIIFLGFGVVAAVALGAFGYFLGSLEVRMGNDRRPREPLIRTVIIGVLMCWCIAANLFFQPGAPWKAWLIVISDLAAFLTPLVWLWLLNVHVSGHLRVNQAWKRL